MKSEGQQCFFDKNVIHPRVIDVLRCSIPAGDDGELQLPLFVAISKRRGFTHHEEVAS